METSPAVIEEDLSCAICGYNLKGLAVDGNCPECGQTIARSYSPDLPRSDPRWLKYQANTMLLLGALCLVNFQPFTYSYSSFQAWIVLGILVSAATVWACWRLGKAEPSGPPGDGEATLQRALRLAPIIYTLIRIGSLLSGSFSTTALGIIGVTAVVSLLLTNALVGWFILRLARRSNDPRLILHARIVAWAFPLSQASDVLLYLVSLMINRYDISPIIFANVIGVTRWILGAAVYYTLLLLGRMHEVLRAAAKVAESRVSPVE
jgi:hypothetical protein